MMSDLGIEPEISCTAVAYATTAPTRQSKVASKTLLFSDKTAVCTWPSNLYAPKYTLYSLVYNKVYSVVRQSRIVPKTLTTNPSGNWLVKSVNIQGAA